MTVDISQKINCDSITSWLSPVTVENFADWVVASAPVKQQKAVELNFFSFIEICDSKPALAVTISYTDTVDFWLQKVITHSCPAQIWWCWPVSAQSCCARMWFYSSASVSCEVVKKSWVHHFRGSTWHSLTLFTWHQESTAELDLRQSVDRSVSR